MILFLYHFLMWYYTIYIVTNQRIRQVTQRGFFGKDVVELGLSKVQSISYNVPGFSGEIFGFGSIVIQTIVGDLIINKVEHLEEVYCELSQIRDGRFDGMIITGAPVEQMEFTDVDYWSELAAIMEWSKHNVYSTLHICWGAQAGLYYHYGIPKYPLEHKMFGVFEHTINQLNCKLLRGFDDSFWVPHSRHTETRKQDILYHPELIVLAESLQSGVYLVATADFRQVFVTGHSEYDTLTLQEEYLRDIDKGLVIKVPENYYPNDNPQQLPRSSWRSHANLLFSNWLNYCVYQETPFSLQELQ